MPQTQIAHESGLSREGVRKILARQDDVLAALNGYTGDDIIQRGLLEPGAPSQQTPFTPEGLARKVREMLDARRQPLSAP